MPYVLCCLLSSLPNLAINWPFTPSSPSSIPKNLIEPARQCANACFSSQARFIVCKFLLFIQLCSFKKMSRLLITPFDFLEMCCSESTWSDDCCVPSFQEFDRRMLLVVLWRKRRVFRVNSDFRSHVALASAQKHRPNEARCMAGVLD